MPNPHISKADFILMASDPSDFKQHFLGSWGASGERQIRQLAEDCCRDYDRRCDMSEEPDSPWQSKRGFPSFAQIAREEVRAHYDEARVLGFQGTVADWAQMVYASRPPEKDEA